MHKPDTYVGVTGRGLSTPCLAVAKHWTLALCKTAEPVVYLLHYVLYVERALGVG